MTERQRWLGEARKRVYATQKEWVQKLNEMGWEIPQSTIANWESVGFLPYSLSADAFNLICRSLQMTANEVGRLQGLDIVDEFEGAIVPAVAVDFIRELIQTDEKTLSEIMPMLQTQFQMLREYSQKKGEKHE